jgi:hypothetical protein
VERDAGRRLRAGGTDRPRAVTPRRVVVKLDVRAGRRIDGATFLLSA